MIARGFHLWERRLASVDTNRVVRPFEWGLEWLDLHAHEAPGPHLSAWARETTHGSDRFFETAATTEYERRGDVLRFPSALATPHPVNNMVTARIFPAQERNGRAPGKAVVVLPQWNSNSEGHVALCRLLARFGVTALRLSLPYHDERRPPELERADYIVSSNVGRTLQANRQAVLDAKRTIDWLTEQGYERIGVLGTSLGSCLAMLTASHEPLVRAQALNHVSPHFADVVWRGLSTTHVRESLDGHIDLELLRDLWRPISPWSFLERARDKRTLLVYAKYDLTFPIDLSLKLVNEFRRLEIPAEVSVLPCGHYSTGKAPFKFLDGYYLSRFLTRNL